MNPAHAMAAVLLAPLAQALLVMLAGRAGIVRDIANILVAAAGAVAAAALMSAAAHGHIARVALLQPLPNIALSFAAQPLGALFAALISGLGLLHAAHTSGFVRAARPRGAARLMAVLALANAAAIAVALSSNLFTMFVAYQALALAGYALTAFDGEPESRRSARTLLTILLGGSMAFLLPAIVWTHALAGPFEFAPGGVLDGLVDQPTAGALLVLYVLGIGLAGAPPMHRWMTLAAGAPFPALPTFYAIAFAPTGAVALLKVVAFVFGPALAETRFVAYALIAICGVSMCASALMALSKQDIRERLAYSSIAQVMCAVMAALLALPVGMFAAALQVVAMSLAGAVIAMAAGAVWAVTGRASAPDYAGLGRVMPWTFAGFALAAASLIGLPPFAGAWARLWLIAASASAGLIWAAVLIGLAAVLTFMHLAPLAANAFASRAPTDAFKIPDGASILLVAPVVLGALATISLLVLADPLAGFLSPTWTAPP